MKGRAALASTVASLALVSAAATCGRDAVDTPDERAVPAEVEIDWPDAALMSPPDAAARGAPDAGAAPDVVSAIERGRRGPGRPRW